MKRLLSVLLILILIFSACSARRGSGEGGSSVLVYRLVAPEYQTSGELLEAESVPLPEGTDAVSGAVAALSAASASDRLISPLPAGVRILSATQHGREATAEMSAPYVLLNGMDKTVLDSCIVLTLCSIRGVERVSIVSGGKTIESGLRADDILLQNSVKSSSEAMVRLYFPADRGQLRYEYRSLSIDDESSVERAIVEALLKGPDSPLLSPALPEQTVLLSVYTQEGVCSVSLSEDFAEACDAEPESAPLRIYSLVNTLCSLSAVTSVQLLIEGRSVSSLGGCDVSQPLIKNENLTGSPIL